MIKITFPNTPFRIRESEGKEWIFDEIRKLWVRLTPEEWVRQNILQYLVEVLKYPPSLIAIEKEITVGELKKRFDVLVYKDALPWMMIECKEMNIPLDDSVLRQLLTYHITLQTGFLFITNGKETRGFAIWEGQLQEVQEFPSF